MRLNDVLLEKQNYETLFDEILRLLNEYGTEDAKKHHTDDIKNEIKTAKTTLKRMDRIQWYLKMIRALTYRAMTRYTFFPDEVREHIIKRQQEESKKMNIVSGPIPNPTRILSDLGHYLSMVQIPKIQNYQFTNQPWPKIKQDFDEFEDEWRSRSRDNGVKIQDGDKIILKFDGGKKAWWLLDRSYCRDEGDKMGHCGNTAAYKDGDNILSFRTATEDPEYWVPHMTFILNHGVLGEMKGKANKKPESKYHPYIVALLKSDYVKEIRGGGYAPEQNFSLNDLPREVREELLAKKPDLGSLYDMFKMHGFNRTVEQMIYDKLDENTMDAIESVDENVATLMQFDDLEQFMREIEHLHKDFEVFYNFITNHDEDISNDELIDIMDAKKIDPEIYIRMAQKLTDATLKKIEKRTGKNINFDTYGGLMDLATEIEKNTELRQMFNLGLARSMYNEFKGVSDDDINQVGKNIIYLVQISLGLGDTTIQYDENDNKITNIRLELDTEKLIEYLSADPDDYDDYEAREFLSATSGYLSNIDSYNIKDNLNLDEDEFDTYHRIMNKIEKGAVAEIDLTKIENFDFDKASEYIEREMTLMDSTIYDDLKILAGIS